MAMGMSYAEFWDSPPHLAVAYRKAYHLKREMDNEQAWLQGMYVYGGFSIALMNAFSKKGGTTHNYFERPFDIFPLTERQKKQREQEELDKMQKALEAMRAEQQRKKKQR